MKLIKQTTIVASIFTAIFYSAIARAQSPEKSASVMIQGIAKECRIAEKDIVIQMKDEGQRFLFSIDGSDPRVLEYGEIIQLKQGFKTASFKARGRSIVISAGEGIGSDFVVSEVIDTRSSGGERKLTTGRFKIADTKILDSTPPKIEEQNRVLGSD